MIYLVAAALIVTAVRYFSAIKRHGAGVLLEIGAAVLAGLVAGLWLGLLARVAMRVLAFAAGAAPRLTAAGSMQVIIVFTGIGAGLAVLYAGLFRHALASSGLKFGLVLLVVSAYPLTQSGIQLLPGKPELMNVVISSGAVLMLMWLPYAWLLAFFTGRFHRNLS